MKLIDPNKTNTDDSMDEHKHIIIEFHLIYSNEWKVLEGTAVLIIQLESQHLLLIRIIEFYRVRLQINLPSPV